MTEGAFRRIALGMAGAIERAHMGHPDFRANGRIFATLRGDGQHGMVKLTPDEQSRFLRDHPDTFVPESGAWGRQGCTRVRLDAADEETIGEAMTLAWRATAATLSRTSTKVRRAPAKARSDGTTARHEGPTRPRAGAKRSHEGTKTPKAARTARPRGRR